MAIADALCTAVIHRDVGQAAAGGENIADKHDVVRTMRSSSGFGKQQAAV